MDPVVLTVFVVGMVVTILLPTLLMKNISRRMQFEQMDGKKIIQVNIHAGMLKGRLRLAAYLIPLPVIILTRCFSGPASQGIIIGLALVVVFACLSAAQYFGVVDKLSTAEMESRRETVPDAGVDPADI